MLHYLRAENAVQTRFRLILKIGEQVGSFGIEPETAAVCHRFFARFDALRRHAGFPHQPKKLATPAPDIKNVAASREVGHVETLRLGYVFFRATETVGEAGV